MSEAATVQSGDVITWVADTTYTKGDVVQVPDRRTGIVQQDCTVGNPVGVDVTEGAIYRVPKTTSMVMLIGSELFWDHSANKAHLLHVSDRDFYLGCSIKDELSDATTVLVALNQKPVYTVSLEHGYQSVPVQTLGFPKVVGAGRGVNLMLNATSEAQKVDALSFDSISVTGLAECIGEALIAGVANGTNTALDVSIGFANGTDATDADQITESIFVHLDGNDLKINLESDDGATEVAATDSTIAYVLSTPFLVQWDFRNLSDIQVYINGVLALTASVFKLNAAAGPFKALAHVEKSIHATVGNYSVIKLGLRSAQNMI